MIHRIRSIRRLARGAGLAAVAFGLVPAMASAGTPRNPTCTFNEGTHQVSLFDKSDVFALVITREGIDIAARNEGNGATVKCFSTTGSGLTANIFNTDKITVFGTPTDIQTGGCPECPPRPVEDDTYVIDESRGSFGPGFTPEADGISEIEIVFETGGIAARLAVNGTEATASAVNDEIRVGGPLGFINFGSDNDIDVKLRAGALDVTVAAGAGADLITGRGNLDQTVLPPTTVPLDVDGGGGADTVVGGDAPDELGGGADDDFIRSNGGLVDVVGGGPGVDDRAIHDPGEIVTGVEHAATNPLGALRLNPGALYARAGVPTRLRMSWTHPRAWRELRSVMLRLYDNGNRQVGMINVRPSRERLTADGVIALASGSGVVHHGKRVTARLAMRLPRSLAGHSLRIGVQATDRHGRTQLEPDAGSIRVTR